MTAFLAQTLAENGIGFILTALAVATIMATVVVILARRVARASGLAWVAWGSLLATVAGVGVWTTHFVAILGYRPDAILGYDPWVTLLSAAIGIVCFGLPLWAACSFRRPLPRAALGAVAGLGIGAMHFTGMSALQGCSISHDTGTNLVALGLGAVFTSLAVSLRIKRRRWPFIVGLSVLGICALHFTALYGVSLTGVEGGHLRGIDAGTLSGLVVLATLGLCTAAVVAARGETRLDTQRRQAAAAQDRQNELFLLALRNMSNGLVMVDADGRISATNPRAHAILGLDDAAVVLGARLDEALGAMLRRGDLDGEEGADFIADHLHWIRAGETVRVERRFSDGHTLSVICGPLPEGGAILTYDDVTEHRAAQDAMIHMAYHDALTGLPNRRSFREEAQRLTGQDAGASVLMLDLDRFKWVNDTHGHAIGDALLIQVADRLRRACAPGDQVYRLGGDEIAVISRDGAEAATRALAEALLDTFRRVFQIDGHSVGIGCSIGFACAGEGERRNLVEKADLALYRAKALGRGRVVGYESGMMERAIERRQVEADLALALERSEFELRYQPLHSLPEQRLLGFEALIRWRHPIRGMVSPAEFVPISEANGMILEIGAWVLEEACRQLARWPGHLHVAINASAVQLRSPGFADDVAAALARHGVAPRRLEVELTETAMVEDGEQLAQVLKALRKLGVRIAMDDFGTGYSSLAHLRDFELDRIKIDRSFVDAEANDAGARAVIRAVTSLARDMEIVTIGEGVETAEQLARLIELGCDVVQGYHLGRPLNAAETGTLISRMMFAEDLADERRETRAVEPGAARRIA